MVNTSLNTSLLKKRSLVLVLAILSFSAGIFVAYQTHYTSAPVKKTVASLTFKTTDGQLAPLSSITEPLIIINFWATWCKPCAEELPALDSIQHRYRGAVKVIAVAFDEPARSATFLAAMKLAHIHPPHLSARNAVAYGVSGQYGRRNPV